MHDARGNLLATGVNRFVVEDRQRADYQRDYQWANSNKCASLMPSNLAMSAGQNTS
jgi:hypothetical protein